jgi:hypothetical protein
VFLLSHKTAKTAGSRGELQRPIKKAGSRGELKFFLATFSFKKK